MKYLYILITCCVLVGCEQPIEMYRREAEQAMVVRKDGCQYLVNPVHGGTVYTHKGDCDNPIHACK